MKLLVNIARVLVGILFIFSGLVKAIDPLGMAYKMQEFFEVWARDGYLPKLMMFCFNYALSLSIIMITLEVVLGVALLLGYAKKIVSWLLFLLISFFTFLTSYVLFTNKIRACGCFGDCIPLTPTQTFIKDIILLILILFILINKKYISHILNPLSGSLVVLITLLLTLGLQWYVLRHLPLIDCLPYKKGNNIIELRKMPTDAVPDKFEYSFVYEKNGEKKEFAVSNLPDSTWKFVERKQKLVQKGKNNVPLINDFSLKNLNGEDSTEAILSQEGAYYLFFVKDFNEKNKWSDDFADLLKRSREQKRNLYIVTASPDDAQKYFNEINHFDVPVFTTDATAIKTAARVVPTVYLMNGPVVKNKKSWLDINQLN